MNGLKDVLGTLFSNVVRWFERGLMQPSMWWSKWLLRFHEGWLYKSNKIPYLLHRCEIWCLAEVFQKCLVHMSLRVVGLVLGVSQSIYSGMTTEVIGGCLSRQAVDKIKLWRWYYSRNLNSTPLAHALLSCLWCGWCVYVQVAYKAEVKSYTWTFLEWNYCFGVLS